MSTHVLGRRAERRVGVRLGASAHWVWLGGGYALAFAVPFVLADTLDVNRDVFYGLHAVAFVALFAAWARSTGYDVVAALRRRLPWALALGAAFAGVLAIVAVRSEEATARPEGLELVAAVLWRGVVYGAADGLMLSAFPILAVFAAFAGTRLNERLRGRIAIGAAALVASLAMTAVYHLGFADFRSDKLAQPLRGDAVWSVPTLVTLNPVGAPIAHAGLHVSAVLHSYETDLFLPPHD